MRWLAMAIPVVMLLAVLWLDRGRKRRKAASKKKEPEIAPEDPDYAFYKSCTDQYIRYIGEKVETYVHHMHVPMTREGEVLFARVPATNYRYLANLYDERCPDCRGRLFTFYVTRRDNSWRREYYGEFAAKRLGQACGSCGKKFIERLSASDLIDHVDDENMDLATRIRLQFLDAPSIFVFVQSYGLREKEMMYY